MFVHKSANINRFFTFSWLNSAVILQQSIYYIAYTP